MAALEAEVAALTKIGEEAATAAEAEKARAEAERLREALTGRCHGAPSIRFCS